MTSYPKRVLKRDGREVPFELKKISDAIERALVASGADKATVLAEELASAVALSITRSAGPASGLIAKPRQKDINDSDFNDRIVNHRDGWNSSVAGPRPDFTIPADSNSGARPAFRDVPDVEQIDELVERVLRETGRVSAAQAYVSRREERARARLSIAVHHDFPPTRDHDITRLRAASGTQSQVWSKGKIVTALMMEAELPRPLAEEIASQVESRVFASGLRRISTSLLRELVDNELFSRGLETHLRRQAIVGLPKYDLREGLRSGFFRDANAAGELVAWSGTPESSIVRNVLSRFAIEDVLSSRIADRHLSGDLHFDGLDAPHRDILGAISLKHVASGAFPALAEFPSSLDFDEALDQLRELKLSARRGVSGMLIFTGVDGWFQDYLRGGKRGRAAEAAERFVRGLALGDDAPFALQLDPSSAFTSTLLIAFTKLCAQGYSPAKLPRIFLSGRRSNIQKCLSTIEELRSVVDLAEKAILPPLRIAYNSENEWCVGPGLRVNAAENEPVFMSCGGAALINLPRLALHVPAWSEGRLLERILQAVDDAVEGLAHLQTGLKEMAVSRGNTLPVPRRSFMLGWVGLRECVRALQDGAVDPRVAQTITQAIFERVSAASMARGVRVIVEPWIESIARSRFERLDADQIPRAQIFSDGDRVHYSEGTNLSPVPGTPAGVVEAFVLSGLQSCLLPRAATVADAWDFAALYARGHGDGTETAPQSTEHCAPSILNNPNRSATPTDGV